MTVTRLLGAVVALSIVVWTVSPWPADETTTTTTLGGYNIDEGG